MCTQMRSCWQKAPGLEYPAVCSRWVPGHLVLGKTCICSSARACTCTATAAVASRNSTCMQQRTWQADPLVWSQIFVLPTWMQQRQRTMTALKSSKSALAAGKLQVYLFTVLPEGPNPRGLAYRYEASSAATETMTVGFHPSTSAVLVTLTRLAMNEYTSINMQGQCHGFLCLQALYALQPCGRAESELGTQNCKCCLELHQSHCLHWTQKIYPTTHL